MFSSAVKLADLDDFLTPAQDCIKPLLNPQSDATKINDVQDSLEVRPNLIKPRIGGQRPQPVEGSEAQSLAGAAVAKDGLPKTAETGSPTAPTGTGAQVSLYDCLACSGCVTSAEAILIEKQGVDEFLSKVKTSRLSVVSISAQSRTSLASYFSIEPYVLMRKLSAFFKQLGVTYVLDMSVSEAVALLETRKDFVRRYQLHKAKAPGSARLIPMLISHCPGWVCYAEKILGSEILTHMSSVISSQQIQGKLVKHSLRGQHDTKTAVQVYRSITGPTLRPFSRKSEEIMTPTKVNDIFHACIMPCFDKKLESTRPEFHVEGSETSAESPYGTPEVDLVLATTEVLQMLEVTGTDIHTIPPVDFDDFTLGLPIVTADHSILPPVLHHDGVVVSTNTNFGSGGYLDDVYRFSNKTIFGSDLDPEVPLSLTAVRNEDYKEVTGSNPLKFAAAYGFRNIQNIVKMVKRNDSRLPHFVEVMACPGGCLNGGGQILESNQEVSLDARRPESNQPSQSYRENESTVARKRRLARLEEFLHKSHSTARMTPELHPLVKAAYAVLTATSNWEDSSVDGSICSYSFKSIKDKEEAEGLLPASALKW